MFIGKAMAWFGLFAQIMNLLEPYILAWLQLPTNPILNIVPQADRAAVLVKLTTTVAEFK
jgi:hypothetical protein